MVSFVLLSFYVYYLDFTLFSMQTHTSMTENYHHPVDLIKSAWSYYFSVSNFNIKFFFLLTFGTFRYKFLTIRLLDNTVL